MYPNPSLCCIKKKKDFAFFAERLRTRVINKSLTELDSPLSKYKSFFG